MNNNRPFRKLYSIVGKELVFLRLSGKCATAAKAPLDRLDLVPLSVVEPLEDGHWRVALRDEAGGAHYLTGMNSPHGIRTTVDRSQAAVLSLDSGVLRQEGRELSAEAQPSAWKAASSDRVRRLDMEDFEPAWKLEDEVPEPVLGYFYQEYQGVRYYLQIGKDGVLLVRNPAERQRLMICGDHFVSKTMPGYYLCRSDDSWHITAPTAEGEATAHEGPSHPHAGAALFRPVRQAGGYSFITLDTPQTWSLRAPLEEPATGRIKLVFASDLNAKAAAPGALERSKLFQFEPFEPLSDFYFWIYNEGSRRVLTSGAADAPEGVACEDWNPAEFRQLWRFEGNTVVSMGGHAMSLPLQPAEDAALTLQDAKAEGGGGVRFGGGAIFHVDHYEHYAVEEDPATARPMLRHADETRPEQQWRLFPYRATPGFASEGFSSLQGRSFFTIFSPRLKMVWARRSDGSVALEEPVDPPSPEQVWAYSNGFLYDDHFHALAVVDTRGALRWEASSHGIPPSSARRRRWGFTSDGCIVLRTGATRVIGAIRGELTLQDFNLKSLSMQQWKIVPLPGPGAYGLVEPLAQASVRPISSAGKAHLAKPYEPDPKSGSALVEMEPGRPALVYTNQEQELVLARGERRTMHFESSVFVKPSSLRPSLVVYRQELYLIRVEGIKHYVEVVPYEKGEDNFASPYGVGSPREGRIKCPTFAPVVVTDAPAEGGVWLFARTPGQDGYRLFTPDPLYPHLYFQEQTKPTLEGGKLSNPALRSLGQTPWQTARPAMVFLGDTLHRLMLLKDTLLWDSMDLRRSDRWTPAGTASLPLPVGTAGVAGTVATLGCGDHVRIAFTTVDGLIWTAEFYPGENAVMAVRRIAGLPRAQLFHPNLAQVGGAPFLSYAGEDREQHMVALA